MKQRQNWIANNNMFWSCITSVTFCQITKAEIMAIIMNVRNMLWKAISRPSSLLLVYYYQFIIRNMLVPIGVTSQRQRAKFIVRIYRADGLPRFFFIVLSLFLLFTSIKHLIQAEFLIMMMMLFIKQDELFHSGKSETRLWSHQQGLGEW